MKYPRIKPELDRRMCLSVQDKEIIKQKYSNGTTISDLKREYNKHYSTIQYIVDPKFREKNRKKANEANKRNRKTNPEWCRRHRELSAASHRYKRSVTPEEKEYDVLHLKMWKEKTNYKQRK